METRRLHSSECKFLPDHFVNRESSQLPLRSAPTATSLTHRYFNCFYESFKTPSRKQAEGMRTAVLQAEKRCRLILGHAEKKERCAIVHSFGYHLHRVQPQLLSYSGLSVVPEEEVHRRLIVSSFFDILREACILEEHRRRVKMMLPLEVAERRKLESMEVQHRIRSMRAEKDRLASITINKESLSRLGRTAHSLDRTSETILLLQEAEKEARLEIQRQHFLIIGSLNYRSAIGIKANQRAQDRYELFSYPLVREKFSRLTTEEACERTSIIHDSYVAFRALAAEEAVAFCFM